MKTWTNPIVEELEVKMTADGGINSYVEDFNPFLPDLPILNDSLNKKDKTQS